MIKARTLFGDPGGSRLPVGIHENVDFTGISADGKYTDLTFQKEGQTVRKRLFAPQGNYPFGEETQADALERETNENARYVVHLMRAVLGDEATSAVEAPDYDSFMSQAAALLNSQVPAAVNLKVVPNRKEPQYSDLPQYASSKYPSYVERYVPGQNSNLTYTAKEMELIEKHNSLSEG